MNEKKERMLYIYTEYCPGDFYWGWWMYASPVVEGKVLTKEYEWLRYGNLAKFFRAIGLQADWDAWKSSKSSELFMSHFPDGALVLETTIGYETTLQQIPDPDLWKLLKQVRESQLLDWKNSDKSYLAWVEQEKQKQEQAQEKLNLNLY